MYSPALSSSISGIKLATALKNAANGLPLCALSPIHKSSRIISKASIPKGDAPSARLEIAKTAVTLARIYSSLITGFNIETKLCKCGRTPHPNKIAIC